MDGAKEQFFIVGNCAIKGNDLSLADVGIAMAQLYFNLVDLVVLESSLEGHNT